jgi:glucose-6-phosphate 1-dehydrogenase
MRARSESNSRTVTYAAVRFQVENWRWAGAG